MKRNIKIAWVLSLLVIVWATPVTISSAKTKPVSLPGYDYVFQVPEAWDRISDVEGSMLLHLKAWPKLQGCKKKTGVISHFTVHLLNRRGVSMEDWVEYHLTYNIPETHGHCQVDTIRDRSAGDAQAKIIEASRLEKHEGYHVVEALVFTAKHVLMLCYLHDKDFTKVARENLDQILDTFQDSPEAVAKSKDYYASGRTLGLEQMGIFLELPKGWIPDEDGDGADAKVSFPGGRLDLYTFRRVSSMDSLKKMLHKKVKKYTVEAPYTAVQIGRSATEACRCRLEGDDSGPASEYFFGLHGKGGFAMVLFASKEQDSVLFDRVLANALLVSPSEVRALHGKKVKALEDALKRTDLQGVQESLTLLSLFSGSSATVRKISKGLKSRNESIRLACTDALGKMGSPEASRTITKVLKDQRTAPMLKEACLEALGTMGGKREKEILINLRNSPATMSSPELRRKVDHTLAGFSF